MREAVWGGWQYSVGLITESVLGDCIPEESNDALMMACRLPLMIIQFVMQPNSVKMKYDVKDQLVVF